KAIALDPDFADAYSNRGIVYTIKDDHDSAIVDHTRVIELNPDDTYAHIFRGGAYEVKGDYDRAIIDYTQAIKLDPDDPFLAYLSRGRAYKQKGDNTHAKADYAKVAEKLNELLPYPDVASLVGCLVTVVILLGLHFIEPRKKEELTAK
ncbi:MAG: tetratricopeptide repeat protein, partial [Proteobacteria bacterium]|nr:tetratricopeptide repeat protein [Pseudomonadota bacterium]